MKSENLDQYEEAYRDSFEFHDENIAMLSWYVERILSSIKTTKALSLLSLGIGHEVVSRRLLASIGDSLERYVIVEGSSEILTRFRTTIEVPHFLELEHHWFEEYSSDTPFDCIEMGFVLEHVDDPRVLVERYGEMLSNEGRMYVAVPNALSLHRRIGHQAELLEDMYALSRADLKLGHKRYFDRQSLSNLLTDCGLEILSIQGIFLKPFSTSQLNSLVLSPEVVAALYAIGANQPDLCNAILIEARKGGTRRPT